MNIQHDIQQFHNKFGILPNQDIDFKLRYARLLEELNEFDEATTPWDKLDAIVDAVYIAAGTIYLYGDKHNALCALGYSFNIPFLMDVAVPPPEKNPTLPNLRWLVIENSVDQHVMGCWYLITNLLSWCAMNRWDFPEAWERVQAANMAKVRASSAADSKHGSAQDIIKPAGWTAPDHRDLFEDVK